MNAPVKQFLPRRISQYVPAMQYDADIVLNGAYRVSLGSPTLPDTDGILDGVDTTAVTGSITVEGNALLGVVGNEADSPFGRNITVTGAGAGAKVLTLVGRDYLGQPMKETVTCSSGNATGIKCFKWLDSIELGAVAGDADTDFGWGAEIGLPYKTVKVLSEEADGAPASVGTLTAPVLTDPATATTGDPRGTYDPGTTLDGSTEIHVVLIVDNSVNSDDNGGLHGIAHFFS